MNLSDKYHGIISTGVTEAKLILNSNNDIELKIAFNKFYDKKRTILDEIDVLLDVYEFILI
jgi:hypothetical protein